MYVLIVTSWHNLSSLSNTQINYSILEKQNPHFLIPTFVWVEDANNFVFLEKWS